MICPICRAITSHNHCQYCGTFSIYIDGVLHTYNAVGVPVIRAIGLPVPRREKEFAHLVKSLDARLES